MKKSLKLGLVLLGIFFVSNFASAATVTIPGHTPQSRRSNYFETTITNRNLAAVSFSVPSFDRYLNGLNQALVQGTTGLSRTEAQIRVLNNIATLLKNPRSRINSHLFAGNLYQDPSMMSKFLTFGPSSLQVMQCGNTADIGAYWAVSSGYFDWSDIRIISYDNVHTLAEYEINDSYWALVDFDPGMPAFMNQKPDGTYASAAELGANPSLAQQWNIFSGSPTSFGKSLAEYSAIFAVNPDSVFTPNYQYLAAAPDNAWKLCKGCQILWKYSQPVNFDIHNQSVFANLTQMFSLYRCWLTTNNQTCFTDLQSWLNSYGITGINQNNALTLSQRVAILYGQQQENFPSTLPTFTVRIPASQTAQTIGVNGDIRIPLFIYRARITGGSVTVDGQTLTQNYQANLYNTTPPGTPGREEPTALPSDLLTLTSGTIPAGVSVEFDVLYNPGIISFMRGFAINQNNGVTLSVIQSQGPLLQVVQQAAVVSRN